jgi:hypothetical protein
MRITYKIGTVHKINKFFLISESLEQIAGITSILDMQTPREKERKCISGK